MGNFYFIPLTLVRRRSAWAYVTTLTDKIIVNNYDYEYEYDIINYIPLCYSYKI